MIAGCIDRLSHNDCGGCERRSACSFVWTDLLKMDSAPRRREPAPLNPFLAFLGQVAKAIEQRANPAREAVLSRQIERHLEPLLPGGEIRIETVARALGISRQTLYRRLKAEGTTFEQVLDGLRRRLALAYVRKEGMPVKEAAWRLGFSDPAAFSRAFKRWTGTSPGGSRPSGPQPG